MMTLSATAACEHKEPLPPITKSQPAAVEKSDGPRITANPFPHEKGDPVAGRDVYRFETFGNEGFWTDAMRIPQGILKAKFTPIQALKAGLQIDIEAIDPAMQQALAAELKTDLSPQNAPMLNDVKTTVALINANAVVGIVPKDSNGDGTLDLMAGDKAGIACTICHTITDKSVYNMPNGGSIGRRIDGPAALTLDVGALLALAANSRAYYPNLQVTLGGKTHGRAPKGLTPESTEEEVDAYLKNRDFYPVGTFDETSDGNGNPVKNQPLFRTDLSAPWGTAGEHQRLDDISNASYTMNLDQTTFVTPEGKQFLTLIGGAAGDQLARDYEQILMATGVTGYPFVKAEMTGKVGKPESLVGRRVDNKKLLDMNAYLDSLQAPPGAKVNAQAAAHGRDLFRTTCTACHHVDQSQRVPPMLVDLKTLWPAYNPTVLAERPAPFSPIQDSPGTFDDKMIVIDASHLGRTRGNALPLLLDLDRTTIFLHDASVHSLDELLDPKRGANAPHPFYFRNLSDRADMVAFLRSLDTSRRVSR
ncbi:MAG TPA: hypothetical protein VJ692_00115 [Nitrospiraceae bacterium]|nr:hypothetical protein [Nitrospiraceae bacterium]